jgi:hypothetical protein
MRMQSYTSLAPGIYCLTTRPMVGIIVHSAPSSTKTSVTTVVNKQVSGAQKPRLDLLIAYLSLVVTYTSLAATSLG